MNKRQRKKLLKPRRIGKISYSWESTPAPGPFILDLQKVEQIGPIYRYYYRMMEKNVFPGVKNFLFINGLSGAVLLSGKFE
jgi:hypothetical protein